MWGGIVTEVSLMSNFHIGFNNTKSDILLHLAQWQYWWWFWFSYFWVLYFLLFMRIFRYRVLKFKPRLATTYRPHGKWGDLIVCLLPVSWCANIITNSNFILRMIEWQAESSLFTLRVRGKQWYWVYKYDLKAVTDVLTAPKNIGNNKWVISNPFDLQIADDYLHIHQLRAQSNWIQNYWNTYLNGDIHNLTVSKETAAFVGDLDFYTNYVQSFSDKRLIQALNPTNYLFNLDNIISKLNKSLVKPEHISFSYEGLDDEDKIIFTVELDSEIMEERLYKYFTAPNLLFNLTSNDALLNFITPDVAKKSNFNLTTSILPTNSIFIDDIKNFTNFYNITLTSPIKFTTDTPHLTNVVDITSYNNPLFDFNFGGKKQLPINIQLTRLRQFFFYFGYELNFFNFFSEIKSLYPFNRSYELGFSTTQTINPTTLTKTPLNFEDTFTNNYTQFNWNEDDENLLNPPAPRFKKDLIILRYSNLFMDDDSFINEYINLIEPTVFSESVRNVQSYLCYPWRGSLGRLFSHSDAPESAFNAQRGQSIKQPVRLIKFPLSYVKETNSKEVVELFRLRFGSGKQEIEFKNNAHQTYFIFKQKRYKRVGSVKTKVRYYMDWQGNPTERIHTTYQPYVDKNRLVMSDRKSHMTHYEIVKTSRRRQENIALPFNKRLLRTRRMVVLPAHVNIAVITNSFDVVHSWFIPGLGVKLDCIPGRSTHHVLHIDNVGFYYGQCAEICGRYHHHMPIRICALPFEHFMVWWHAFAMPRMLKAYEEPLVNFKKDRYFYSAKKYVW